MKSRGSRKKQKRALGNKRMIALSAVALSTAAPWWHAAHAAPCSTISVDTTIGSSEACLDWTGGSLTIASSGLVAGDASAGTGVYVSHGNWVAELNNAGTITGAYGIENAGGISTIRNSGIILATQYGIYNSGAGAGTIGAIINDAGGQITGDYIGLAILGAYVGTIVNRGTISGTNSGGAAFGSVSVGYFVNESTGTISGPTGLNNINGMFGTVLNRGTITGTTNGLYSNDSGTITSLVNEGVISGTSNAINVTGGKIGTLINRGLIAGNITNTTAEGLNINGGDTDASYGVLTGKDGTTASTNIGQITHTSADLNFVDGFLLLNDHINTGTHDVINTGATVKLVNAISITGNYTQTGGGLVVQAADNANYGSLDVSGNAAVSNTTLVIAGNNLQIGETYTIVGAGGTGSYAITKVTTTGSGALGGSTQTVGNDLVVTIRELSNDKYASIGAVEGGVASPFGRVLDRANSGSSPEAVAFQTEVLAAIDSLPDDRQGSAIKALAPVNAANTVQMAAQSVGIVSDAIGARQQLAMAGDDAGTTGMSAGDAESNRALWGQILGGTARLSGNADNEGFNSHSYGLAGGVDHLITPNLLGGVALSWLRSSIDGRNDASGSSQRLDSYQLTLYGTYRQDRFFVDGQLGVGWNHFDQDRVIDFLGRKASASYSGQQYLLRARAGYDLPYGTATITPFAGLQWVHAYNESYDETGAGPANNSVDSMSEDVVTHEIGAKATWRLNTQYGELRPSASLAWIHDYNDNAVITNGQIGGTAYSVRTDGLSEDGARVGLGVALDTSATSRLLLEYNGEFRSGYRNDTATLRVSWDF